MVAKGIGAVVVASVDAPMSRETIEQLIEAWRASGAAIVVPRFEGKNGHPALFDGGLLAELQVVQDSAQGLKAVREAHREGTQFVDVDDALVGLNLNTPEDYAAAKSLLEG